MTDVMFCGSCGGQVAAHVKFCQTCGARQADFATGDLGDSSPPGGDEAPPTPAPGAADPKATQVSPTPAVGASDPKATQASPIPETLTPFAAPEDTPPPPHTPPPAQPPAEGGRRLRIDLDDDETAIAPPPGLEGTEPSPVSPPPPPRRPQQPTPGYAAMPPTAAPPPPPPGQYVQHGQAPVGQRIEQVAPGAGELLEQVRAGLQTPGVAAAGIAALVGVLATIGVALLCALAFPEDSSLLGLVNGEGIAEDTARQTMGVIQAPLHLSNAGTDAFTDGSLRTLPLLFILVPFFGCAFGGTLRAGATRDMPARQRLLWGAATGIPFALLMVVPAAIAAGDVDEARIGAPVGSAVLLGLLWGGLGGLAGMWWSIRRDMPQSLEHVLPPQVRVHASTVLIALRALLVALAVTTALGTATWLVATLADVEGTKASFDEDRSTGLAVIENTLYGVEHGVHFLELGSFASFEAKGVATLTSPVPVSVGDLGKVLSEDADGSSSGDGESATSKSFTVFTFGGGLSALYFIPLLLLILVPLLGLLYAGFAIAGNRRPRTPGLGAAWGSLAGPVWAIAMIFANALVNKPVLDTFLFGKAKGDSVFLWLLLIGAAAGAAGGFLASGGLRSTARPGNPPGGGADAGGWPPQGATPKQAPWQPGTGAPQGNLPPPGGGGWSDRQGGSGAL